MNGTGSDRDGLDEAQPFLPPIEESGDDPDRRLPRRTRYVPEPAFPPSPYDRPPFTPPESVVPSSNGADRDPAPGASSSPPRHGPPPTHGQSPAYGSPPSHAPPPASSGTPSVSGAPAMGPPPRGQQAPGQPASGQQALGQPPPRGPPSPLGPTPPLGPNPPLGPSPALGSIPRLGPPPPLGANQSPLASPPAAWASNEETNPDDQSPRRGSVWESTDSVFPESPYPRDLPPRSIPPRVSPFRRPEDAIEVRREARDHRAAERTDDDLDVDLEPLRRSGLRQRAQATGESIDIEPEPEHRRVMPLWQELPL